MASLFTTGPIAYRGYLICWSIFPLDKPNCRVWVEKDGQIICWADTLEQAKERIDEVAE